MFGASLSSFPASNATSYGLPYPPEIVALESSPLPFSAYICANPSDWATELSNLDTPPFVSIRFAVVRAIAAAPSFIEPTRVSPASFPSVNTSPGSKSLSPYTIISERVIGM